jgi:hypothetical protein
MWMKQLSQRFGGLKCDFRNSFCNVGSVGGQRPPLSLAYWSLIPHFIGFPMYRFGVRMKPSSFGFLSHFGPTLRYPTHFVPNSIDSQILSHQLPILWTQDLKHHLFDPFVLTVDDNLR